MERLKGPGFPLLCMDLGNTSTSYAVYRGGRLEKLNHVDSNKFPYIVSNILINEGIVPSGHALLSSVVPRLTLKVKKSIGRKLASKLWVIGGNLSVPLRHKYFNIHKLGSDRRVNLYGAAKLYGAPVLILDFGTALTCDYVSEKGVFMGGLIIPGPEISLQALSHKAALLPQIPFPKQYKEFIGKDTVGGMKAGVLQGYGAMTDGLIERFRRRFGRKLRAIATGGLSPVLYPYTSQIDILDPSLTLKALAEVFKDRVLKISS